MRIIHIHTLNLPGNTDLLVSENSDQFVSILTYFAEYLKEHGIVKRPLPSIDTTPLPLRSDMIPGQAQAPPSKAKGKRSKRTRLPKPPLVGSQHAGADGSTSAFALAPPAGSYNFLTPTAAPPQSLTSTQHPLFKIPVGRVPSSAPDHAMDEDEGSRSSRPPSSSQARNEKDNGKGKGRMTRTVSSGSATSSAAESASVAGGVRMPVGRLLSPCPSTTPKPKSPSR